jgi:hypothetical protein
LRRDPVASRPWGLRVVWDEFGQACLVESVDPISPAAAAVRMFLLACRERLTPHYPNLTFYSIADLYGYAR